VGTRTGAHSTVGEDLVGSGDDQAEVSLDLGRLAEYVLTVVAHQVVGTRCQGGGDDGRIFRHDRQSDPLDEGLGRIGDPSQEVRSELLGVEWERPRGLASQVALGFLEDEGTDVEADRSRQTEPDQLVGRAGG
jgi:hypothetical protein